MFQFEMEKVRVARNLYHVLPTQCCAKARRDFIQQWLKLLKFYCNVPGFLAFDTDVPGYEGMSPHATKLVITRFPNDRVKPTLKVSVMPLHPFRAFYVNGRHEWCAEGLEFIVRYLKLSGITTVGFEKGFLGQEAIVKRLQEEIPNVQCYAPQLLKFFYRV